MNQPEPIRQETIRWQKPARGRYKCNIDAFFSSSLNRVGLGMCIQNDAGEYVLARIDWFSPLCDVVIGEAVGLHTALKWASDIGEAVGLHTTLQWASDLQFDNVNFVVDSQQVVDSFHADIYDHSEFDCIINASRQLFHESFQNSHVEFNMRQTNVIAHELAKASPSESNPYIYDDAPSCI